MRYDQEDDGYAPRKELALTYRDGWRMTDTDLPVPAAVADLPLAPVALEIQRTLLDAWLSWLTGQVALHQYSEFTRIGYQANIRHWFAHLENVARTDQPTAGTVQRYVQALIASGREPATVNLYLNTVKSFYRWCESEDRYPSIARSIRTVREFRDGPLPALSHGQIVALVTGIPEDTLAHCRDRAMIALMYATAFRSISIVRADVEDLDLDRLTIVHQPKGHIAKDTQAAMPQAVAAALRLYLDRRRLAFGPPQDGDVQPLFIALDRRCTGQRITAKSVRFQVLHYMEKAGHAQRRDGRLINPGMFSAHSMRRSASVTTADAVGLEVAQGLLGHASIETTRKSYARVNLERKLRENAERLNPIR
jgi:integrase/recombinase XerC